MVLLHTLRRLCESISMKRFPRDGLAEEAHWNGHHALPTFNPNGLLFWGNVKDNVYGRHPTSIDDLKSFISDEFSNINSQRSLCENVCRSVRSRLRLCIDCQGSQFEQLLWKFLLQNFGFFVLPFWFGGKITSFVSVVIAVLFMLSPAFLCF